MYISYIFVSGNYFLDKYSNLCFPYYKKCMYIIPMAYSFLYMAAISTIF